jgi:DNA-binding XRE family transcriptional regulator
MPTLRELREDAFLTQRELAQACGVTYQTISEWERGQVMPSMKHRRKLAEVLNQPPSALNAAIRATVEAAKHE